MSGRKFAAKKRHSAFDSIYNQLDAKPEEFCRRRERAFPAKLTAKQKLAIEVLREKRDLFL